MCGIGIIVVEKNDDGEDENVGCSTVEYEDPRWDELRDRVVAEERKPDFNNHLLLSRRGPDWQSAIVVQGPVLLSQACNMGPDTNQPSFVSLSDDGDHDDMINLGNTRIIVHLEATVLHLRGSIRQPYPVKWTTESLSLCPDESCNINSVKSGDDETAWLCWNGEVYQIIENVDDLGDSTVRIRDLPADEADTETVAKLLQDKIQAVTLSSSFTTDHGFLEAITSAMSFLVNAEFAFCLVTPHAIYYGRDGLGRRSLLECSNTTLTNGTLPMNSDPRPFRWRLASAAVQMPVTTGNFQWKEVLPGRIFEYQLATGAVRSLQLSSPDILPLTVLPSVKDKTTDLGVSSVSLHDTVSSTLWQASLHLEHFLQRAIQLRLPASISYRKRNCVNSSNKSFCNSDDGGAASPRVAVLFSGGLDSAVLAALTLDLMSSSEPLELWNVSFGSDPDSAADRQAAWSSVLELSEHYPNHEIRFICMDVDWTDVLEYEDHILQLLHPKPATTMDFNIATALWFASRGIGNWVTHVHNGTTNVGRIPYVSNARILLLGMGADEQMAGYGRHRKAYIHGGWSKLRAELDMDLHRLWERNLGRDDRVVSDHGREARFPFLDTNVMQYLMSLPLADICNLKLAPGVGDKQILRQIALRKGLVTAGGLVKRAIQFGSRIAHVSDKQRFGSRRQAKGDKQIPRNGCNQPSVMS